MHVASQAVLFGGDDLIAYSHHVAAGTLIAGQIVERDDTILVVVNLHPTEAREGNVALDLGALGLADGVAFEVYGEPWSVFNPRTRRIDHIEATLRRTS